MADGDFKAFVVTRDLTDRYNVTVTKTNGEHVATFDDIPEYLVIVRKGDGVIAAGITGPVLLQKTQKVVNEALSRALAEEVNQYTEKFIAQETAAGRPVSPKLEGFLRSKGPEIIATIIGGKGGFPHGR